MSFQREINRLAGTTNKEAQHAANVLAGTTGKELLFALNKIAGTTGRGINHVLSLISIANGGLGGKDANIALDDIEFGEITIGGFDSVIRSFSQGFSGGAAYYDGGGLAF